MDSGRRAALGSPHDGYAAVLLTVALAAVIFGFGASQHFLSRVETDQWWWIPFAVAVIVGPVGYWAFKYYLRAHGANPLHGAPMPWLALTVAGIVLLTVFLEPLVAALGSYWLFAAAALVLATLTVAPVQLVLSKDPKRTSETT